MNSAHLHLLVNHIPVFGVAFGILALAWSLFRNSSEMRWAALGLFVVSGLFVWISTQTGDSAEQLVEHLPGVSEAIIHEHEESAEVANILVLALAAGSLVLAWVSRCGSRLLKASQVAVLLLALISGGFLVRAANLGGQIRHSEIRGDMTQQNQPVSERTRHSDD